MPVDDRFASLLRPRGLPRLPLPSLPHPGALLVRALNALLKRESWARDRLIRHAGKTVRVAFGHVSASVTIDSQGYVSLADSVIVPDVTLTLASEKLSLDMLLALGKSRDGAAIIDITHISGDAGLTQVIAELAQHLRWDVEDDLAQRIGDVPALKLTQGARALAHRVRTGSERLASNVAEYIAYERPILVNKPVFEDHQSRVGQLQVDTEALQKRFDAILSDAPTRAAEGR